MKHNYIKHFCGYYVMSCLLLVALILLITKPAAAEPKIATTDQLTQMTAEWVELNKQINEQQNSRQEESAALKDIEQLLEKELLQLKKEIKAHQKKTRGRNQERLKLIEEKRTYEKILERTQPLVAAAEERLLYWEHIIPGPLKKTFTNLFDQVKKGQQQSPAQRLQRVLNIYAGIEQDQAMIHVVKEVLHPAPELALEFDVLYIGYAQAYAVSVNNKTAGWGYPGRQQWAWHWDAAIADSVRAALDYYQHQRIADFVRLPIKIERKK